MDYKYIEQLLERYWQCRTTQQEEQILRAFFSQRDVPAQLLKYRELFTVGELMKQEETLGDDFDARLLSMTEGAGPVRARTITLRRRLMPLFKAAAVVAIVITLGNAAQLSFKERAPQTGEDINYAGYKDTFSDPAMAYDRVHNALQLVSAGMAQTQDADSAATAKAPEAGGGATSKATEE